MVVHPVIVEPARLRAEGSEVQVQVRLCNNLLKENNKTTENLNNSEACLFKDLKENDRKGKKTKKQRYKTER